MFLGKRERGINIRLREDEYQLLNSTAERLDVSISFIVRKVLLPLLRDQAKVSSTLHQAVEQAFVSQQTNYWDGIDRRRSA